MNKQILETINLCLLALNLVWKKGECTRESYEMDMNDGKCYKGHVYRIGRKYVVFAEAE